MRSALLTRAATLTTDRDPCLTLHLLPSRRPLPLPSTCPPSCWAPLETSPCSSTARPPGQQRACDGAAVNADVAEGPGPAARSRMTAADLPPTCCCVYLTSPSLRCFALAATMPVRWMCGPAACCSTSSAPAATHSVSRLNCCTARCPGPRSTLCERRVCMHQLHQPRPSAHCLLPVPRYPPPPPPPPPTHPPPPPKKNFFFNDTYTT